MVAKQNQQFLDGTDCLNLFQSGFRPHYCTETTLVALVDDLRRELDRESMTLLIPLDLSLASDTIYHLLVPSGASDGLWCGQQGVNLGVLLPVWQVSEGECCSNPWPLKYGVPQGFVLSAMPFNMKLLGEVNRGLRLHRYQCANAATLPLFTIYSWMTVEEQLNRSLQWISV